VVAAGERRLLHYTRAQQVLDAFTMATSSRQLRLAIVDDDSGFLRVLANRLEATGWEYRAQTASPPLEELVAMRANALLVDPACLGSAGWDYVARVCEGLPSLGIVVCTARSTVAQRVRGLRLGADDWITKPCHPEEVVARLEAVARRGRRSRAPVEAGPVVVGDLELRPDQFQAFVGGRSVELTRREFEVLHLLADAKGRVLQREDIYQRVWGYAMAHGDRSVDVFVRKLRSKIERASPSWSYIHTHFGIGYRFQPEPVDGRELEAVGESAAVEPLPPAAAEAGLAPPVPEGEVEQDDAVTTDELGAAPRHESASLAASDR
jgi:DNA-binding response OmpR family regulator